MSLRNNKPIAAVVSIKRLNQLEELEEDLIDASLAVARMLTTGPERYSLDEVLEKFGYTRDGLRDLERRSPGGIPHCTATSS